MVQNNRNRTIETLRFFIITSMILVINYSFTQHNFIYDNSIKVSKENGEINLPWTGGLNHPQFSKMDIDFDGVEELIAFEPENNLVHIFKITEQNGEIIYTYVYNGQQYFPTSITERVALVDFDNDGRKDLFTYAAGNGIKVYRNISTPETGIKWQLFADPIMSMADHHHDPIFVNANEIPAYVDVDGDGDLDILTFHFGVKSVDFHKNMSMENYGVPDSLDFVLESSCWGGFIEGHSNNDIVLNATTFPCGTNPMPPHPVDEIEGEVTVKHQGGGSLLVLDYNGNGLMDALVGDIDYKNMTVVINGGHDANDIPLMTSLDNQFPSYDTPLDLSNYLTAYYEDVNLDGIKDLIVSTSYRGESDNTESVWLYINEGTNNHPDFKLKTKKFLQENMIENGKSSVPIFVDVNNDGLTDLLVANHFNFKESGNSSRINYYKNIGTEELPSFELTNKDWNAFSESGHPTRVIPAFGDLDGDGDLDMVVGLSSGKLFYYENGGGNGPMNFNVPQFLLKDNNDVEINVPIYATPILYDLDNDGLLDLIISQGTGPLIYYKNIGTAQNHSFELVNSNLGNIDFSSVEHILTTSVPHFYEDDNETKLLIGMRNGKVRMYNDISNNLQSGSFNLLDDYFAGINVKGNAAPALGKIRNDDSYDLFVGMETGGLWSYREDSTLTITEEIIGSTQGVLIYPNPNDGSFTINISSLKSKDCEYAVIDPLGRVLEKGKSNNQDLIKIQLDKQQQGIYFVKIKSKGEAKEIIQKIIIK